jgi:hypothetical protein
MRAYNKTLTAPVKRTIHHIVRDLSLTYLTSHHSDRDHTLKLHVL